MKVHFMKFLLVQKRKVQRNLGFEYLMKTKILAFEWWVNLVGNIQSRKRNWIGWIWRYINNSQKIDEKKHEEPTHSARLHFIYIANNILKDNLKLKNCRNCNVQHLEKNHS